MSQRATLDPKITKQRNLGTRFLDNSVITLVNYVNLSRPKMIIRPTCRNKRSGRCSQSSKLSTRRLQAAVDAREITLAHKPRAHQ